MRGLVRGLVLIGLGTTLPHPRTAFAQAEDHELDAAEAALDAGRLEEARTALARWLEGGGLEERPDQAARARFLRARLTADPDSAEADYQWAALEGDARTGARARLALAQLRLARGDPGRSERDLERLRADFPGSELEARSWLWTGYARDAMGDRAAACAAWGRAMADGGDDDPDVREPAEASLGSCPGARGVAPPASTAAGGQPPGAAGSDGFTVQLGAFRTREAAERRRDELAALGVEVRVEAPARPDGWYRVRMDRSLDRESALDLARRLRREGHDAFVVRAEDR